MAHADNGNITVISDHAPADVYVGGILNGTTDGAGSLNILDLAPNNYILNVTKSGYNDSIQTVSVAADSNQIVYANLTQTQVQNSTPNVTVIPPASIFIVNNQHAADVYLNGILNGTTDNNGLLTIPNVEPGDYLLKVSENGFENSTQAVSINGTDITVYSNLTALPPVIPVIQNGGIILTTSPGFANVYLNGTFIGATPSNGHLEMLNLTPGPYDLTVSKTNFSTNNSQVLVSSSANTSVSVTLTQTVAQGSSSGTSLKTAVGSPDGADHEMFETETAQFYFSPSSSDTVQWFIDGTLTKTETTTNSSLSWNPGIFFTPAPPSFSKIKLANITAKASAGDASWLVDVHDAINPYFTQIDGSSDVSGSSDTQLNVFVDTTIHDFTGVNVTITGDSRVQTFSLSPDNGTTIVDWKLDLVGIDYGSNFLTKIVGFNNNTNSTKEFSLTTERGHYRNPPQNGNPNSNSGSSSGSGGGGGGGFSEPAPLTNTSELVYVAVEKDVIKTSDEQTIKLDAKDLVYGIKSVEALIRASSGPDLKLNLKRISGDTYYGTWSLNFSGFFPGQYKIYSVTLDTNETQPKSKEFLVQDRGFYVESQAALAQESLGLVYSILNVSKTTNGTDVLLSVDARDKIGITGVEATVKPGKGPSFVVPLTLVGGNKNYGTWSGVIKATIPDTTFSVVNITLSNFDSTKSFAIKDRSFYVSPLPKSAANQIIGNVVATAALSSKNVINYILKQPLVPTLFALAAIILITSFFLFGSKIGEIYERFKYGK